MNTRKQRRKAWRRHMSQTIRFLKGEKTPHRSQFQVHLTSEHIDRMILRRKARR